MNETTSQQWLWATPLPDAISGVIQELRMPVVTMRSAIDLIEKITSCQVYQRHQPILCTHVDRIRAHIDQLFDLWARFERINQQGDIIQHQAGTIIFVQAIISDLCNDLEDLQQGMPAAHADCYTNLEAQLQPIFMMIETSIPACLEAIQSLLHDGLLQRLRNEQGRVH